MNSLRTTQYYSSFTLLSSSAGRFHEKLKATQPCSSINLLPTSPAIKASTIQGSSVPLPLSNASNNSTLSLETVTIEKSLQPRPSAANSCPLTPIDFLERAAVVYGDSPAILYNETTRTWSETHIRCLKLASSIVSLGIKTGDVVSVLAPNVPAMYELHFAVPMAGAILNTINLHLDANAISNLLQHSGSMLVFVDCQSASLVHEAISRFPSNLQRPALVLIVDENHECSENSSHQYYNISYEDMVARGDPGFNWVRPNSEWDPIALNYTSGTTSSPKGVLNSHRGAFLISINSLFDWSVPKQPVYLWTLPMFHVNGWGYTWAMAAVGGANVCLRRVDAPSIFHALENYKVTHMCGAPVVLNMLTNHPAAKLLETPVHIMTGGAPPPAALLGRAESMGFIVSHGYGLTETGGLVVTCAWKKEWDNLAGPERARLRARQGVGTVGFPGVDVVDSDSGESVARDGLRIGEIVLRGGSVMLGYLNDPEGTAKCMRKDGWFYTGDIGVMHPDGYLEVKDRLKDVIICGGENMSSVEVEAILYMHPAVNEAAVVPRPDRYWGETPCAFVSFKEDVAEKPTEREIREFCKARLPLYMVPRMVVFKDELPKTSTGKIRKFLLRNMAKDLGKF